MIAPSSLTASQLQELRSELLVERARLHRTIETVVAGALANSQSPEFHDTSPQYDAVVPTDVDARFDAVVGALARLEAGTYGRCNNCDQPIPFGRLLVMPEATHCVGCRPRG